MKKLITAALISLMVTSMSISVYAHCRKNLVNDRQKVCSYDKECVFVDVNGDGICDNCDNKHEVGKRVNFIDANGDSICDNCGNKHEAGKKENFIDTNEDGICDNYVYNQSQEKECETRTYTGNSFKNHRHGCK